VPLREAGATANGFSFGAYIRPAFITRYTGGLPPFPSEARVFHDDA
jgi:hypothetical protein